MAAHSCIINAWSLSEFVGFCLSTRPLRIQIEIKCIYIALLRYGKMLHHAGKGIVHQQTVPGWLGVAAL